MSNEKSSQGKAETQQEKAARVPQRTEEDSVTGKPGAFGQLVSCRAPREDFGWWLGVTSTW